MKVMTIIGTRPEGIKMAPVIKALQQDPDITSVFVNTAQHREMLDQVLHLFGISSDYDLNIMKTQQRPEDVTAQIITSVGTILEKEQPDIVLVHGDTTTTFSGAYAAFMKQVPVGHVEAGLRTHNKYAPFPEEMNRQLVGRIATFHFAATEKNKENLLREGIQPDYVPVVGNTVIDALLDVTQQQYEFNEPLKSITESGLKTILMTTHRRENLDQLQGVYRAVNRIIEEYSDVQVVFPVHKNPVVRKQVQQGLHQNERVHIIEPQDYEVFAQLLKESYLILTDSGGIQEEAPALGKPVLVARSNTERPEGVTAGTLKLVGTDEQVIYDSLKELLDNKETYQKMSEAKNPFGDGTTSQSIISFLKNNQHKLK